MTNLRILIWSLVASAASISTSFAGPCATQIDQTQRRIDAWLESRAAAGPGAVESPGALTHRQPTPGSIAAAEEKLDELSAQKADAVKQAMTRARAADSAGDQTACDQALAEVQQQLGP